MYVVLSCNMTGGAVFPRVKKGPPCSCVDRRRFTSSSKQAGNDLEHAKWPLLSDDSASQPGQTHCRRIAECYIPRMSILFVDGTALHAMFITEGKRLSGWYILIMHCHVANIAVDCNADLD